MSTTERTTGFDAAVLIGRFQPFHNGHAALLEDAFAEGRKVVLVLGSAGSAPTPRNPFSASQREEMIRASLDAERNARLLVLGQRDVWDMDRWAMQVRTAVAELVGGDVALVGHHKDDSSSYLDHFPDWTLVEMPRRGPLDATPLRERILSDAPDRDVMDMVRGAIPSGAVDWLETWSRGPWRQDLIEESVAIHEYRRKWGTGPLLAANAVVRFRGCVLLHRRIGSPGKGLWAIPGGLLLPGEQPETGARRESTRLTGIVLDGFRPVAQEIFAHPGRSLRGRITAHVFLYEPDWAGRPAADRTDGSVETAWVPVADLVGLESRLFEDHFHILDKLLGGILTV
jgi:bifunctional NMN adenylyltransferase/nudix hydrolase